MTAHIQQQPRLLVRARRRGRRLIGAVPTIWIVAVAFFVIVPLLSVVW